MAAQNAVRVLKVAISSSAGTVLPEKLPSFVLETLVLEAQQVARRQRHQQHADGSMQLFIDALQLLADSPNGEALNSVQRKWFDLEDGEADGLRGRQLDARRTVSVREHAGELLHVLLASRVYSFNQTGFDTLIEVERWVRMIRLGDEVPTPLGDVPSWVMGGGREDGLHGYIALSGAHSQAFETRRTLEECKAAAKMNHAAKNLALGPMSRYTRQSRVASNHTEPTSKTKSDFERELLLLRRDAQMSEVAERMLQARLTWLDGEVKLHEDDFVSAVALMAEALKLSQRDGDPFSGRWMICDNGMQPFRLYHRAIDAVLDGTPSSAVFNARLVRAYAMLKASQMQSCLVEIDKCVQLDPFSQHAFHLRLIVRGNLGNWQGSLADAECLVQMSPFEPMGYYWRAIALRNLQDKDCGPAAALQIIRRAQGSFLQFLGLASPGGRKVCQAWYDLHLLELLTYKHRGGAPSAAEHELLNTIADRGEEAEAHMLEVLREHEARCGASDCKQEVQMWQVMRYQRGVPATVIEGSLQKANTAYSRGDYQEAISRYNSLIRLDKTDTQGENETALKALSNRAAAFIKLQEFGNAECDAQKVVELSPEWVKGYLRLARARLGRLDGLGAMQAIRSGKTRLSSSDAKRLTDIEQDVQCLLASPPPAPCDPKQLSCWSSVKFQDSVVVVDSLGRGDFVSVREAIKSVQSRRVTIIILGGKYNLSWPGFLEQSQEKKDLALQKANAREAAKALTSDSRRASKSSASSDIGHHDVEVIAEVDAQIIGEGSVEITIEPQGSWPACVLVLSELQSLVLQNLKLVHYAPPNNAGRIAHCVGADGASLRLVSCELRSTAASCWVKDGGNVIMTSCKAYGPGSAVLVCGQGSKLQADNCTFTKTRSVSIEIREGGRASLNRCRIAAGEKQAICLYRGGKAADLIDCTFEGCGSLPSSGGLMVSSGTMTLRRCHVLNNRGDGIVVQDSEDGSAHLELICTLIFNNGGHGLAQYGGSSSITGCRVQENAGVGVAVSEHRDHDPKCSRPFRDVTLTRNHFSGNGRGLDVLVHGRSRRDVGDGGRVRLVHNHAEGSVVLGTADFNILRDAQGAIRLTETRRTMEKSHKGGKKTYIVDEVTGNILADASTRKKRVDLRDELSHFLHIAETLRLPNANADFAAVHFHKPALVLSHERVVTSYEKGPNANQPPDRYMDTHGPKPLNAHVPRVALPQLRECCISDLAPTVGSRAVGRVLYGELCTRPFRMRSLQTVIADDLGAAVKLSLYNFPAAWKDDWRESFPKGNYSHSPACKPELNADCTSPPGMRIGIKEPFLKRQADTDFGVRVDDPLDIVYVESPASAVSQDGPVDKATARADLRRLAAVPQDRIDIPGLRQAIETARCAGVAPALVRAAESNLRDAVAAKAVAFET